MRGAETIERAAASIADDPEVVVIGSQAILGRYPDAPPSLLGSETLLHLLESTAIESDRRDLALGRPDLLYASSLT